MKEKEGIKNSSTTRQVKVKILAQLFLESQNVGRAFRDHRVKHLHFTNEQPNTKKHLSGTTTFENILAVFYNIQHGLTMFTWTT